MINFNCDRCGELLQIVALSKEEIKETLKTMDYKKPLLFTEGFFLQCIMIGYTSYECPKCKWRKFIKNSKLPAKEIDKKLRETEDEQHSYKCKNCGYQSDNFLMDFTTENKHKEIILKCPNCGKNPYY